MTAVGLEHRMKRTKRNGANHFTPCAYNSAISSPKGMMPEIWGKFVLSCPYIKIKIKTGAGIHEKLILEEENPFKVRSHL